MIKKDILTIVKYKIRFLSEEELSEIMEYFDFRIYEDKQSNLEYLNYKLDYELAMKILNEFKDRVYFNTKEVTKYLNLTNNQVKKLVTSKKINVTGYYELTIYGRVVECPKYDILQTLAISPKEALNLIENEKKLSDKKIKSLEKARKVQVKNRTCKMCGYVESKTEYIINGLCRQCYQEYLNKDIIFSIYKKRKKLFNDKENTLIMCVNYIDLVNVNIAIMDLDKQVVFNEDISTNVYLNSNHVDIFRYKKENSLVNKSVLLKIEREQIVLDFINILKDKTLIVYNKSEALGIFKYLEIDLCKYVAEIIDLKEQELKIDDSNKALSLINAVNRYSKDKVKELDYVNSLDECNLCLYLLEEFKNHVKTMNLDCI